MGHKSLYSGSVLREKIEDIFKEDSSSEKAFMSILSLIYFKDENFPLLELYRVLGLEAFIKTMNILAGRSVTFPTRENFKETIIWAMSYYLKELQGKEWSEIEKTIGVKDISVLKYGIRNRALNSFIKQRLEAILLREKEKNNHEKS